MANTYLLFFNEAESELSAPSTITDSNDVELNKIVSLLTSLEKQSQFDKEKRSAAAIAHTRLKAATIIQHAIERNDDLTITRWYQTETYRNSGLLSDEEKQFADKALQRKAMLQMIRNKEKLLTEEDVVFLQGSNLLLTSERMLFPQILSPKTSKP